MKKGFNFRTWKRRFFLFNVDRLDYMRSPDSKEVLGTVPLRQFDIDKLDVNGKDFNIITPTRCFYMRAETLQSKNNWLAELFAIQKQLRAIPSARNTVTNDQSTIRCANCKVNFGITKRKHQCSTCSAYFCSSTSCYSAAARICLACSTRAQKDSSDAAAEQLLAGAHMAHLAVRVVEARELRPNDRKGSADPVAVVYVGDRRCRTRPQPQTLCPYWDEQFELPLDGAEELGVQVCVFDHDPHGVDAFMGMVHLPLTSIKPDVMYDSWFPLRERPSEEQDVVRDAGSDDEDIDSHAHAHGQGNEGKDAAPAKEQPKESGLRSALQSLAVRKLPFFSAKGAGPVSGLIRLQFSYTYSPLLLQDLVLDKTLRATLSKKLFSLNVRRAKRVIKGVGVTQWIESYRALVAWRRPGISMLTFLAYNLLVLCYPADYLVILPPLACLCVLLCFYVDRVYHEAAHPPLPDDGVLRQWEYSNDVADGKGVYDVYAAWDALRQDSDDDSDAESAFEPSHAESAVRFRSRASSAATTPSTESRRRGLVSAPSTPAVSAAQPPGKSHAEEEVAARLFKQQMERKTRMRTETRSRAQSMSSAESHTPAALRGSAGEVEESTAEPVAVPLPGLTDIVEDHVDSAAETPSEPSATASPSVRSAAGSASASDDVPITYAVARDLIKEDAAVAAAEGILSSTRSGLEVLPREDDSDDDEPSVSRRVPGDHDLESSSSSSDDDAEGGDCEDYIPSVEEQQARAAKHEARASLRGALDGAQGDRAEKLGLLAQARRYHQILSGVQNSIGDACALLERTETILTWRDPRRTSMLCYALILAILVLLALPLRLVLFLFGLETFTAHFRRQKLTKRKRKNMLERFVGSAPPLSAATLNNQSLHPKLKDVK